MPTSLSTRRHLPMAVFAAAVFAIASTSQAADDEKKEATNIPVKRVVMFSSGVAFFEHAGDVEGNATVDLKFNVKDVNDLLKSMVLQDDGGGRISTVSYGSKDPITRTLATFSIDLTKNPTLADLLSQIRGEQIEIDAPNAIRGTILGVEKRKVPSGKDQVVEVDYLNLLTDEGLRSVSLETVGRIKLANQALDAELRKALTVLASGKSQDKKAVTLSFLGEGKRPVRVGYVQEAPIWKTSYRLVLADEKPPLLQGWAIVENTTESDWEDVSLTLVSGRPISFVMDLYQPLYIDRPVVQPELYASLRPRVYDQDLAASDAEFRKLAEQEQLNRGLARSRAGAAPAAPAGGLAGAPADGRGAGLSAGGGFGAGKAAERLEEKQWSLAGGQSIAQAGDVGELFRYVIATPVKLQRSQSAMLPIVNDSVQGEKLSIYSERTHAKHPLNGLRLKNTTDLHLMQGPITVFDDGAYAGDAQIQDLQPGTERLISYAMDLDTEVAPTQKQEPSQLVNVRISKGVLYSSFKHTRAKSFAVKNSSKKAKKVLIEYPIEPQWTLVEPKEPAEKTRDLYRFAVDAQPGKPATLDVKEEYVQGESVAVNDLDGGRVQFFLAAKTVSEDVKKALSEVVQRKAAIERVVASRQELERQIGVIDQEQNRIRGNMGQLPKDSDLFRRYVTKFTEQEDKVDALRKQVSASVDEETKLRKSLDDYLANLEIK